MLQRSPILDRRKTGSTGGLLMMMQLKKDAVLRKISCVNISNKENFREVPLRPGSTKNKSRLWPGSTKSPKTLIRKLWQQSTPYWSITARFSNLVWALAIRMLTNGEAVAVQQRERPTGWSES